MRIISLNIMALSSLLFACGTGGSGGGGSNASSEPSDRNPDSAGCAGHGDCGAGEFCDVGGRGFGLSSTSHAMVDEACVVSCTDQCDAGDMCDDLCRAACADEAPPCELCEPLCSQFDGEDQAHCLADCDASCEDETSPPADRPEPPADEDVPTERPEQPSADERPSEQPMGVCRAKDRKSVV